MAVRIRLRVLLMKENLERMREDRAALTIREVAKQTGLAVSTITGLTSGRSQRVDLITLNALCRFLKCTPGDLLEYTPEETGRS